MTGVGKQTYDALTVVDRVNEWLAVNDVSQTELVRRAGIPGDYYAMTWWNKLRRDVLAGKQKTVTSETLIRLLIATSMTMEELLEPFK